MLGDRLRAFSFLGKVPEGRSSVFSKRAAHTECDFWVWEVFPTSQFAKPVWVGPACQVPNHTGMHCSPGSESLASSYVDGKNRQRVLGVLTVECCVGIFVSVQKKGPWVNRVRPDSLSDLSLQSEFPIYIEYLSDRTGTVGCVWSGHRQYDRRVT